MSREELAILRRRMDAIPPSVARPSEGAACLVVQTVAVTSYPTTAGRMYGVQQQAVTCTETENSSPTYAAITGVFYALHTGSTAPAVNTNYLVTLVQGLWVFA